MHDGLAEQDIRRAMSSGPKGSIVSALAHTHGRDVSGMFSLIFSPEDIESAKSFKVNAYLATPTGELVIFDRNGMAGVYRRERL
jgi:hypothetical protein